MTPRSLQQKGGACVGPTKKSKGTKLMAIVEGNGYPIALHLESASPGESTLVEDTIHSKIIENLPSKLIGDKAYDSDKLDKILLNKYGIELITPNRKNRGKTQDGRPLRRHRRRWKVERFFSWLQSYRHIVTRYDVYVENYFAMIKLACSMIFLNLILR